MTRLLTGEENLLRSTPGRSGPPPPCRGPIAISVLSWRHHHPPLPTRFRHWRRRATMIINQSRPAIAATGLRRLASAIERGGGEDTGSEGASR
jgi:hypothetical protein